MSRATERDDVTSGLVEESPYGDVPETDVACADCGAYRTLYGPLSHDGRRVRHGDFVCESCVESRVGGEA